MAEQKISILGCGWLGTALAKELLKNGYSVNGSTTSVSKIATIEAEGITAFLVDFNKEETIFEPAFFDCEVLIISFPPKKNVQLVIDYPNQIKNIANTAQNFGVKQLVLISSTGVYEDGNFTVNELKIPNPTTAAGKSLLAAENTLKSYTSFGTTIIRFAGLFGPGRNLAKYFSGKTDIPNGLAPVNLIHLIDCLGIILAILKQSAFGKIYHGVSPNHPIRTDFYTKSCVESGLKEPIFRNELLQWKQIESVNVSTFLKYQFNVVIS